MEQIIIPILNLELNINKVAFKLCGVPVYWYAILIVFALSLAIFMYYKNDGKFGIYFDDIIDLSLVLIPVSFICARLYYIVFHLEYYTTFERIISIKDRRSCNIWRYNWWSYNYIYILQKKKDFIFRFNRLYYSIFSTRPSNRKMGQFYKCRSIWKYNKFAMENGN